MTGVHAAHESISTTCPVSYFLEDHTIENYRSAVFAWLDRNGCPLCGEKHPWKVHEYPTRRPYVAKDEYLPITIIRILCQNRSKERKNGSSRKQCSIRIAPDFLGPYTHRSVSKIIKAIAGYISGTYRNAIEATMAMDCENEKSFLKYLLRAKFRFRYWVEFVMTQLSKIGSYTDPDMTLSRDRHTMPAKYQWERWVNLCKSLAEAHWQLSGTIRDWDTGSLVQQRIIGSHNPWQGLGPSPPENRG